MLLIRNLVFATAIALFTGFASAHYAIDILGRGAHLQSGQWSRLESIENTAGNPYRAALKVRTSGVVLAPGEGLVFTTTRDLGGDVFEAGCQYSLMGRMPKAALWSLSVDPPPGAAQTEFADRRYLVSDNVLWNSDGQLEVTIAPQASPGNWLASPAASGFTVSLRLYDTPLALSTASIDAKFLPRITKVGCS